MKVTCSPLAAINLQIKDGDTRREGVNKGGSKECI